MILIWILTFFSLVITAYAAAPVCNPSVYSFYVGINITVNTVLATLVCTDADGNTITYSMDTSSNGYSYFGITGNDVKLVNRLDVEYGLITWTVKVLAIDDAGTPETGTATLSLTTYQSTTTTTTTPAPPGYNWFNTRDNVILFGSVMGFAALFTGCCVVMCFRFRRVGTCLPLSCTEYGQCKASFRRQCNCCPLPCDFYAPEKEPLEEELIHEEFRPPLPAPISAKALNDHAKATPLPSVNETERQHAVTPVTFGNVNLSDVGFDGMRSPGFNAPMFTSFGGTHDHPPPRRKR